MDAEEYIFTMNTAVGPFTFSAEAVLTDSAATISEAAQDMPAEPSARAASDDRAPVDAWSSADEALPHSAAMDGEGTVTGHSEEERTTEAQAESTQGTHSAPHAEEAEGHSEPHGSDKGRAAIHRLQGRQTWRPRGQRRSFGRLCKGQAAAGGCAGDRNASAATTAKKKWQQEQLVKEKQREAREAERQMRATKERIRAQRRKHREAKRQQKRENEMKSAKVQIIKDTTKIRKWNKQARRQLVKMSPEMIQRLYGVRL